MNANPRYAVHLKNISDEMAAIARRMKEEGDEGDANTLYHLEESLEDFIYSLQSDDSPASKSSSLIPFDQISG